MLQNTVPSRPSSGKLLSVPEPQAWFENSGASSGSTLPPAEDTPGEPWTAQRRGSSNFLAGLALLHTTQLSSKGVVSTDPTGHCGHHRCKFHLIPPQQQPQTHPTTTTLTAEREEDREVMDWTTWPNWPLLVALITTAYTFCQVQGCRVGPGLSCSSEQTSDVWKAPGSRLYRHPDVYPSPPRRSHCAALANIPRTHCPAHIQTRQQTNRTQGKPHEPPQASSPTHWY